MKLLKICTLVALSFVLIGAVAEAQTVDVYGQVRFYDGSCSTGEGLNSVTVLLYDNMGFWESTVTETDSAFMIEHNLSSPLGIFYFDDVPYSLDYWLEVIPPEGVVLAVNPYQGSWWNANPRAVGDDFYRCFLLLPESHTIGYWKHQAKVAVTGKGSAQIPADELQDILDAIFDQFNGAAYFPIEGVSSIGGYPLTPQDMLNTFNLPNGGPQGMINKTKKQLLAVLLDVGAENVPLDQVISEDDHTISEAIAFGADMITSSGSAISTAHSALDYINNNMIVPPGWIPDGYESVIYGNEANPALSASGLPVTSVLMANYPNPFNPETTIRFTLSQATEVRLDVYDASGRLVATLLNRYTEAGNHQVTFNGSGLASGIYLARIQAGDLSQSLKMLLVK